MVIVMPSLAIGEECHNEIIPTLVMSVIASIAPAMGKGIHKPGNMPHVGSPHKYSPHKHLGSKLHRSSKIVIDKETDPKTYPSNQNRLHHIDHEPRMASVQPTKKWVVNEVRNVYSIGFERKPPRVDGKNPLHVPPK